eukprot:1160408-Pelagomonas_calceolata.AAC.3
MQPFHSFPSNLYGVVAAVAAGAPRWRCCPPAAVLLHHLFAVLQAVAGAGVAVGAPRLSCCHPAAVLVQLLARHPFAVALQAVAGAGGSHRLGLPAAAHACREQQAAGVFAEVASKEVAAALGVLRTHRSFVLSKGGACARRSRWDAPLLLGQHLSGGHQLVVGSVRCWG